jgi:carboxypeptidase Taq
VRLKKRIADCIGYEKVPYDAHLDAFEPGATVDMLDPLLHELKEGTIPLVRRIARSKRKPNRKLVLGKFPQEAQLAFGKDVLERMGFDFTKGRIDLTTHPFCTSFDPADVRLTTRVDVGDLRECLFGLIHEGGHGLYEQGIDVGIVRTPLGHAISLGIHESQSRLYENVVGRSREFWKFFLPRLKRTFPQMARVKLDDFVFAINEVVPSFVRTEADEVTYNLHVVLRYEIEKDVFAGKIKTSELPGVWNRKMKEALGIVPPTHSKGVLQDIHWSSGLFGYFPTYSLGNLYGAQFMAQARKEIPRFSSKVASGNLLPLREWLRERIHRPGRTYPAPELLRRVTGAKLQVKPFLGYIEAKYGELYDL